MTLDQITCIACTAIALAFVWLLINAFRVKRGGTNNIVNAVESGNILEYLNVTRLDNVAKAYGKTISIKIGDTLKSNIPASEFFTEFSVSNALGINTRIIDAGSGTLVGLGLLGTFLGLTFGIMNFESSTSNQIQSSIQVLLSGMGTAFLTSLLGMGASLIYTIIEKSWRNGLAKALFDFNSKLDNEYYIDDVELSTYRQKLISMEATKEMVAQFEASSEQLFKRLQPFLQYTTPEAKEVPISNAIREIVINNEEQTKALKSFSTDLALELNIGFDETLSRQMQQRIVPLMESVDATTKAVIEHIDSMASAAANPAMDMMQKVVGDLKSSIVGIMEEFKNTISRNTTTELENLALSLGSATKAIGDFPQSMGAVSDVLQQTIVEVRNSISEISHSSAAANSSAMKQMQEQIVFATTTIGEAIVEVKEVMSNITHSSEQSSKELIEKMTKSSTQMSEFMKQTMEQLSGVMLASVQTMTTDLSGKQTDLLALQEGTTSEVKKIIGAMNEEWKLSSEAIISQTESLLEKFDSSIERMNTTNTALTGTITLVQKAQTDMTGTTANIQAIAGDMKSAAEQFRKGQTDYSQIIDQIQKETKGKLDDVLELMQTAGETTEEYAEKFETIRNGLSQIFAQIQTGLNDYSTSVRISIQKYLDTYSASLSKTTENLAGVIQAQNDAVEMLVDTVNRKR